MKNKFEIINENSLNWLKDYDGEMFDAVITDPPYNLSRPNNFDTLKSKRTGIDFGDWDKDFNQFEWIELAAKHIKKGGSFIIFNSWRNISHIADKLEELGFVVKDVIRWIKSNPMPRNLNRRYLSDYEFAVWAVSPGDKWEFKLLNNEKRAVPEIKTPTLLGKERTSHPTQKPLKVMEKIIKRHTKEGDLIFEPFMGSGSTVVAAVKNNRRVIGIELSEEYFEISKKRLEEI